MAGWFTGVLRASFSPSRCKFSSQEDKTYYMLKECVECNMMFETNSPAKIRAGGRINTCPECSEESAVKYLGLANGDGKQASVTVLSFDTSSDREKYASYWKANTGYYKGKSCHLSQSNPADPGVRFKTISQSSAANHKGRM